eukprot:9480731-Pyramimonas_sp.AAC.1
MRFQTAPLSRASQCHAWAAEARAARRSGSSGTHLLGPTVATMTALPDPRRHDFVMTSTPR